LEDQSFPANFESDIRLPVPVAIVNNTRFCLAEWMHGAVNRNALIIARFPAGGEIGRREQTVGDGCRLLLLARPQA